MRKNMPIFYSALMLTGVNLLLRLVGTSFQVYLSGRMGAAGVGLLQLVMSVGGLAMTAGMAGIRTTAMYLTAEELGRRKPENVVWVLSACFGYSILCSGAVSLGLYSAAPWIAEHWIGDLRTLPSIRLFSAFLPISCLCGVMSGYFTAANRISTLAAVEVFEQLCSMSATFLLLQFWAGEDAARACQAVVFGGGISGCVTLCSLVVLRLREKPQWGKAIPVTGRLLRCAVPLGLADVVKAGISTTENLMVPKRLARYPAEADPMAAFGLLCGMVFPVLMFPAALLFGLAELLIPELARCVAAGSENRIRYLVRRSLRFSLIYGCAFGALLYVLAEPLCMGLYKNAQAGIWLRRFAWTVPMLYCDALTDAMTKGLGQQKACVRYNILTSALDVLGLFFLLPVLGMRGYYISFLLTHLLNFALSLRRLLKISRVTVSPAAVVKALLCTVAAVWGAGFVPQTVLRAVCCMLLLGCALFLGKVLCREDIQWLRGLVGKSPRRE